MAMWSEIERFRKDAAAARDLAAWLFSLKERDALTDWEAGFLESLREKTYLDELSTRQAEVLLEIRDAVELVSKHRGFNVGSLIRGCYLARLDLEEEDEDWIIKIHERSPLSIRRKELGRLWKCARQLHLLDDEAA
jgi:hypothetical protein